MDLEFLNNQENLPDWLLSSISLLAIAIPKLWGFLTFEKKKRKLRFDLEILEKIKGHENLNAKHVEKSINTMIEETFTSKGSTKFRNRLTGFVTLCVFSIMAIWLYLENGLSVWFFIIVFLAMSGLINLIAPENDSHDSAEIFFTISLKDRIGFTVAFALILIGLVGFTILTNLSIDNSFWKILLIVIGLIGVIISTGLISFKRD